MPCALPTPTLYENKRSLFAVHFLNPSYLVWSMWNLLGISKRVFPGCENIWYNTSVFLPAEGKQNATFSPNFTQPGKSLLEIPCTTWTFRVTCRMSSVSMQKYTIQNWIWYFTIGQSSSSTQVILRLIACKTQMHWMKKTVVSYQIWVRFV